MWTYESKTGKMFDAGGKLWNTGYAGGNEGKNPEGINNQAFQNVARVGPLPVGTYTFGKPVLQSQLGPFAIPLIPDPSNQMFGRSGFYLHGDKAGGRREASEGCIILPRSVRLVMWASDDHVLLVI